MADFDTWLRSPDEPVLLVEVDYAYESAGNVATGTLYLASKRYATGPSDTPAHRLYREGVTALSFKRALDVGSLGGRATVAMSELKVSNADGRFDFALRLIVDGWEVRAYLGDLSWPRSAFRQVLGAVVERVTASETDITFKLRDRRLLLDREVKGDPIGGSGPNSTKYLPLLWGSHFNLDLSGQLYDDANNIYSVVSNYSAGSVIVGVRENGVSLRSSTTGWAATAANTTVNAGTDTFTKTAHGLIVNQVIFFADPVIVGSTYLYWAPFPGMSARPYWVKSTPTADTFTLSATKGGATLDITGTTWSDSGFGSLTVVVQNFYDDVANTGRIQLSSTPTGRITCDILNRQNYTAPFALAKELIEAYGNVDAADIDSAAFTAADSALDSKVVLGYSNFAVIQRRNLIDVLNELIDASFGWYGDDALGRITCGVLDVSGIADAVATRSITRADVLGPISVENQPVTVGRANVEFGYNHTPQADGISSSVSQTSREAYSARYSSVQRSAAPSGTTYSGNAPLYHRTMVEAEPRGASLMNSSAYGIDASISIDSYAQELVNDRRPHIQVIRFPAKFAAYAMTLGECVRFTYPRFGFDSGQNCRVSALDVDFVQGRATVDLLTYTPPDSTTAEHL